MGGPPCLESGARVRVRAWGAAFGALPVPLRKAGFRPGSTRTPAGLCSGRCCERGRACSDIPAEAFERARAELRSRGRSAVTANQRHANLRSFFNWCVKSGRASSNPLTKVSKLNADADRRYVRRPLTEEELHNLLEVAKERGRLLFYAMAFCAGIRRGELGRLTWGDADLEAGTLTIRRGKAKRTDVVPLHTELLTLLQQEQPARCRHDTRLFPELVTNKTRKLDFDRAGIPPVDSRGLRADLHSTRRTLHTMLALSGVPVQVAQRLLRHADYRTTQKHCFHIDAATTGSALRALPSMRPTPERKAGEGCQQKRHKTEHNEAPSGSTSCSSEEEAIEQPKRRKPLESAKMRKTVPRGSTRCNVVRAERQTSLGKRRACARPRARRAWGRRLPGRGGARAL